MYGQISSAHQQVVDELSKKIKIFTPVFSFTVPQKSCHLTQFWSIICWIFCRDVRFSARKDILIKFAIICRRAWDEIISKDEDNLLPKTINQGIDLVKTEEYAFVYQSDSVRSIIKDHCDITEIPFDVSSGSLGMVWKKQFSYKHLFNYYINKMKETGHLNKILRKYLVKFNQECENSNEFISVKIQNVFPAFLLIMVGISISSLLQLGEVLVNFISKRRNKSRWK